MNLNLGLLGLPVLREPMWYDWYGLGFHLLRKLDYARRMLVLGLLGR